MDEIRISALDEEESCCNASSNRQYCFTFQTKIGVPLMDICKTAQLQVDTAAAVVLHLVVTFSLPVIARPRGVVIIALLRIASPVSLRSTKCDTGVHADLHDALRR